MVGNEPGKMGHGGLARGFKAGFHSDGHREPLSTIAWESERLTPMMGQMNGSWQALNQYLAETMAAQLLFCLCFKSAK